MKIVPSKSGERVATAASASGGRIWNEKKAPARVHPAIRELISLGGTQPGRRGFSSCGHRLGSLYRTEDKTTLTLMKSYEVRETPGFFSLQIRKSDICLIP